VTQSGLSVPAQSVVPRRLPCPSAATYSAPLRSARRSKASRREALIKRPSAIPASPGRSFQRHGSCCGRHDDEQLDVFDDDEVFAREPYVQPPPNRRLSGRLEPVRRDDSPALLSARVRPRSPARARTASDCMAGRSVTAASVRLRQSCRRTPSDLTGSRRPEYKELRTARQTFGSQSTRIVRSNRRDSWRTRRRPSSATRPRTGSRSSMNLWPFFSTRRPTGTNDLLVSDVSVPTKCRRGSSPGTSSTRQSFEPGD